MRTTLLVFVMATLLVGCSNLPSFMGRWQREIVSVAHPEGTAEVLTFSPDGVLTLRPPPLPEMADTGHYEIIDEHRMRVELYDITGVCTVRVDRAELRFTDPSGQTRIYHRVQ